MSCSSFARSRQGNVALMFGLLLPAIVVASGIGIDFYRATNTRAALQEATDAAVLAAGRAKMADSALTLADAEKVARKYFDGNFSKVNDFTVKTFVLTENPTTGTYLLKASGVIQKYRPTIWTTFSKTPVDERGLEHFPIKWPRLIARKCDQ